MTKPSNHPNPFAAPQAQVGELGLPGKPRKGGKLMPHEKAGRVIRLMAILSLVGVISIGLAVGLPAMSDASGASLIAFVPMILMLAVVSGLFYVGVAVMRHEGWARVVGILWGLIALLGFPIGTLAGGYVLWQLLMNWDHPDAG